MRLSALRPKSHHLRAAGTFARDFGRSGVSVSRRLSPAVFGRTN